MKQKVSDYIADRLAQEGICQVFTVTGGGAMHLNDSLGHHPGLTCLYQHHEQAAAMAAEAYARVDNRMAAVCVTSGPGATNAITGALCAWMAACFFVRARSWHLIIRRIQPLSKISSVPSVLNRLCIHTGTNAAEDTFL